MGGGGGAGTVQADVLPLEHICGLLGQVLLDAIFRAKTEHIMFLGSRTLA